MFEEEISPEEMFRQFFGGGMGPFGPGFGMPYPIHFQSFRVSNATTAIPSQSSSPRPTNAENHPQPSYPLTRSLLGFDAGPQFVFNFGGGQGFRVHQFGGNRPRRRPGDSSHQPDPQPQSAMSVLSSLLPLLILFIFPLLSSLFGSWSSAPHYPSVRIDRPSSPYTQLHTSHKLKMSYWVNPSDVSAYSNREWRALDKVAEHQYIVNLNTMCENEQIRRQQLVNEAYGWFWTDEEKLAQARSMDMPGCRKLEELQGKR